MQFLGEDKDKVRFKLVNKVCHDSVVRSQTRAKKICFAIGDLVPDFECDNDALVEALGRLGYQVSMPDWKEESHDWSQYDLVTPRLTWDYQNHPEKFTNWM